MTTKYLLDIYYCKHAKDLKIINHNKNTKQLNKYTKCLFQCILLAVLRKNYQQPFPSSLFLPLSGLPPNFPVYNFLPTGRVPGLYQVTNMPIQNKAICYQGLNLQFISNMSAKSASIALLYVRGISTYMKKQSA